MVDVILFSCGGAARRILSTSRESAGVPTVFVDSNGDSSISLRDSGAPDVYVDQFVSYTMAYDNRDEICASMRGMRVVMAFAVLGGSSGTGIMPVVTRCAREEGCKVVSVVGLPLEEVRRERAMRALPEILDSSDRVIILDMTANCRIYPDLKAHRVMNLISSVITFTARSMASLMEGPFFSTFYKKTYTVAYTTDIDPSSAVQRATQASMFDTDPDNGKMVVMVSSGFGTAQIESIYSAVVDMTGIIPDIVKRDDREDTKVLVFLPVQL